MFDKPGAHCACAAPRAAHLPAPSRPAPSDSGPRAGRALPAAPGHARPGARPGRAPPLRGSLRPGSLLPSCLFSVGLGEGPWEGVKDHLGKFAASSAGHQHHHRSGNSPASGTGSRGMCTARAFAARFLFMSEAAAERAREGRGPAPACLRGSARGGPGFPRSARGSWIPPRNAASPGSSCSPGASPSRCGARPRRRSRCLTAGSLGLTIPSNKAPSDLLGVFVLSAPCINHFEKEWCDTQMNLLCHLLISCEALVVQNEQGE